jgi:pilus assembly protein Flp/PilA
MYKHYNPVRDNAAAGGYKAAGAHSLAPGVLAFIRSFIFREKPMMSFLRRILKNDRGATAIEYTLIASLIAVAAIAAMTSVGGKVSNVMSNVASSMK